jgi:hypothetical protein
MLCASYILFTDMTPEVKNGESMLRSLDEGGGGIQQLLVCFMYKVCEVPSLQVSLFVPLLLGYPVGFEKLYQMLEVKQAREVLPLGGW